MDAEFYNKLYRARPLRWDDKQRDTFVLNNVPESRTVIDIGCGTGHTIHLLSKHWPNTTFCGIDISQIALDMANKRVPSAMFVVDDFQNIRVPAAELVLCMGVAEHFPSLSHGLFQLQRYITPDGLLYLEVPNCLANDNKSEEGYRATYGSSAKQLEWHLKRETWERIIGEAGFTIRKSLTGHRHDWEFIWLLEKKHG